MIPYRRVTPAGPWGPVQDAWAGAGRVVVYGAAEAWATDALTALSAEETARVRAQRSAAARGRFLASRRLLRHTVGTLLAVPWTGVRLARTPLGRPVLPDRPDIGISLSHTGGLLAVAVSALGPVGVDTERAGRPTGPELAGRVCAPGELLHLAGLPARDHADAVLRLWTLKEAYVKALGTGLRVSLRGIGFDAIGGPSPSGPRGWSFTTREVRVYIDGGAGDAGTSYHVSAAHLTSPHATAARTAWSRTTPAPTAPAPAPAPVPALADRPGDTADGRAGNTAAGRRLSSRSAAGSS
ncbi:4'-phosphopantetheinyl transferase superfamily protein [Streptomyces sp. NPDC095613]|uniref:4'-phosphopantetheinyl transferase superfamily protein n=1 Tax=Streptomyces sp. NPDC095613 TaxID=3155540 RepID=UPI003328C20D